MKKIAFLLAILMLLTLSSCVLPDPVDGDEETDPVSDTIGNDGQTNSPVSDTKTNERYDLDADENDGITVTYAGFTTGGYFELGVLVKSDDCPDGKSKYYTYLRRDPVSVDVAIETDALIAVFETSTEIESIVWDVYTVKGADYENALYIVSGTGVAYYLVEEPIAVSEKPVIYLYPETVTDVTVTLDYVGTLTHTYPKYNGGWRVTAYPDGTLVGADGREYYCLFWDGVDSVEYDMSEGFVVSGDETEKFLEDALAKLGLNAREANEFIIYWLPRMENNAYNLISFQTDTYTDAAKLYVDPAPDTLIRVFMTWKALDEPVSVIPQTLASPEREGFTVVEWGGSEIK